MSAFDPKDPTVHTPRRTKRHRIAGLLAIAAGLVSLPMACSPAQEEEAVGEASEAMLSYASDVNNSGVNYAAAFSASQTKSGASLGTDPPMSAPMAFHYIFYGTWTTAQQQIFLDFANGLSGSPAMSVIQSYFDQNGLHLPGTFTSVDGWNDSTYSQGKTVNGFGLEDIVDHAVLSGALPNDPNAMYFIVLASDVNVTNSTDGSQFLCTQGCGSHGLGPVGPKPVRFGWAGNPQFCVNTFGTHACGQIPSPSPNGDGVVDVMVSTVYHETAEEMTNPGPNHSGWHVLMKDGAQVEIADMCEVAHATDDGSPFNFPVGPVQLDPNYTTSNGAAANVHLGSRDFILPSLWQNADRGGCVRRLAFNRPAAQIPGALNAITGDLDHNGWGDLIWRNSTTGQVSGDLFTSTGFTTAVIGNSSRDWNIYGVGDFDKTGTADILWQNVFTGGLDVWLMSGTTMIQEWSPTSSVPADQLIKAVGDFNGDGFTDVLFQSMTDNSVHVWNNVGSTFTFSSLPASTPAPSTSENFESIGAGDFNGAGRASVLWHDPAADTYQIWSLSGTTISRTNISNTGWKWLFGVADIDHDGIADLVGISSDESSVVWMKMGSGFSVGAPQVIGATPAHQWRYSGSTRFGSQNGILWRNRQTGDVARWLLDNTTHTATTSSHIRTAVSQNQEIVAY